MAGITEANTGNGVAAVAVPQNDHWAKGAFDYLISKGMVIHETRFDDKPTRGEVFALLAQLK
jgi:hypothetical protein